VLRNEEIIADRKAAEAAGVRARVRGLQKYGYGTVFRDYWNHEVSKLMQLGYVPPIVEGFARYIAATRDDPDGRGMTTLHPAKETERFRYHPPAGERIAALSDLAGGEEGHGSDTDFLAPSDCLALELRLVRNKYGDRAFDRLSPIEWDHAAVKAHLPFWEEVSRSNLPALTTVTVSEIPRLSHEILNLEASSVSAGPSGRDATAEIIEFVVGSSLSVILARAGFELVPMTMRDPAFSRGGVTMKPFSILKDLRSRAIDADEWSDMAGELGIGEIPLADMGTEAKSRKAEPGADTNAGGGHVYFGFIWCPGCEAS